MSEDQKIESAQKQEGSESAPETKVQEVKETDKETVSQEDLDALDKAISEANASLVSKDVQEQIKLAKEEAKKEAELEFLKSQKIKELEDKLKAEEAAKADMQKETAEKLASLKSRLDTMSASRAVAPASTPFDAPPATPKTQLDLSAEEIAQIEKDSFRALVGRTINKN